MSILEAARASRNRGDFHVFLGDPLSDGGDKTTVEPGNETSPGIWTCGIGVWIEAGGRCHTAAALPAEAISWTLRCDRGPSVESRYELAGARVRHETCHRGGVGMAGVDFHRVEIQAAGPLRAWIVTHTPLKWGGWKHFNEWNAPADLVQLLESSYE